MSIIYLVKNSRLDKGYAGLQFQQSQISIAVVRPVLALLCHIVLEDVRRFRVIPVQSVQDSLNMLWPIWRIVECNTHSCGKYCRKSRLDWNFVNGRAHRAENFGVAEDFYAGP